MQKHESCKAVLDSTQKFSHTITQDFILGKPKEGEKPQQTKLPYQQIDE
jgi:hypothetical protein